MNRRAAALALSGVLSGASFGIGVACSSFDSTVETNGTGDAHAVPDAPEASVVDADAGVDATPSPCVGAEQFLCADFNAPPYTKGWTEEQVIDGGTLVLDPSTAVSAPSSLRASVIALDAGGCGAMLTKRVAVTPQQVTLSFALRVDETSNASANVAAIELGGVPGGDGAYFLIIGTDLEAQIAIQVVTHPEDGGIQRTDFVVPFGIPIGEWRAYTMVLALPDGGPDGTISLLVDGSQVLGHPVSLQARRPARARASASRTSRTGSPLTKCTSTTS